MQGNWVWADGEPAEFVSWSPGEPGNHKTKCNSDIGGESVAVMGGKGIWHDWSDKIPVSDRPDAELEPADVSGCVLNRQKYVCSKPASQGARVETSILRTWCA